MRHSPTNDGAKNVKKVAEVVGATSSEGNMVAPDRAALISLVQSLICRMSSTWQSYREKMTTPPLE